MIFKSNKEKVKKDNKAKKVSPLMLKLKTILKLNTKNTPKQIAKEIILHALVIQLLLELLNHRSIITAISTVFANPLMFLCSIGLIGFSLSFGLLLPKRHIAYLLASTAWLWLGLVNFIVLGSRTTPLTAMDFKMLTSVFTVIGRYLNTIQIVLFALSMIALVIILIVIIFKLPRTKWSPKYGVLSLILCYTLMMSSFQVAVITGNVSRNFGNIADAYKDYGFAYSFATSVVDQGIQRPSGYSTQVMDEILDSMDASSYEADKMVFDQYLFNMGILQQLKNPLLNINDTDKIIEANIEKTIKLNDELHQGNAIIDSPPAQTVANIVMVQLESYFDVKRLKALKFNQDPTPNMTRLANEYTSGFVTVPSIGAGTANTEFEILTGMSLDYFGAGEYPFKTILSKQTVESYAYDLSELGYNTHAIHNNMGTFYARHSVYPRLGFDGFTSIEYMKDVKYNQLDWAKDEILIPEILKAMKATTSPDFVFSISVQPHGKYPDYKFLDNPIIKIEPNDSIPSISSEDEAAFNGETNETENEEIIIDHDANYYKFEYYVNQIYECDQFVGDLINELENYPEPVIAIFYGDHLPSLDITDLDLTNGTPYQTEYVIWDNMDLEINDSDMMSYQLGSAFMNILDYDNGIINKFHQTKKDSPNYEKELELLQYDILYGDKEAYGGVNPFNKKKVKRGVDPISIFDISIQGDASFIHGQNFTKWSEIFINGSQYETLYIDENTLITAFNDIQENTEVKVSQVTETGKVLSSSNIFTLADKNQLLLPFTKISKDYYESIYEIE